LPPQPPPRPGAAPTHRPPGKAPTPLFHIPVAVLLYALLVLALLAAIAASVWWARRLRPSVGPREDALIVEDSEDLREAVESGRSALRTVDDARAAIIACYLAMERSLADRGTARGLADTPDELLSRARARGVVRGTAAARLTALFYEARFSSHPLGPGQRDAAEQALDELAAALAEEKAEPEAAGAGT
jgi:nitroreductase